MLDPGANHVFLSDHIGRINGSYDGYRSWKSLGTERKVVVVDGDDDSGVCSPPLWRTSPTASPQHQKNHYRSLSPSSRTQAIARGQRELMEMVSRMPESCYELSMKDLVEQPIIEMKQESFREEKSDKNKNEKKKKKNKKDVQMLKRSGSLDNERFLLKMVFPVYMGSKKNSKKRIDSLSNSNISKITPKSTVCDGSDKEWWKKTQTNGSSNNSGSAKSSSASSSSSRSSSRQGSGSCWPFMRTKKSKKLE
ncbi:hypothetical protein ACOSQ4_009860 [Xanthoceras sorbifolium]